MASISEIKRSPDIFLNKTIFHLFNQKKRLMEIQFHFIFYYNFK